MDAREALTDYIVLVEPEGEVPETSRHLHAGNELGQDPPQFVDAVPAGQRCRLGTDGPQLRGLAVGADLATSEPTLVLITPTGLGSGRYRPPDRLLAFPLEFRGAFVDGTHSDGVHLLAVVGEPLGSDLSNSLG